MSIDILQEKIRKTKNPSVLELAMPVGELPPHILEEEESAGAACARFCRELMERLKGMVPAVRISFSAFALLGHDGLYRLSETLKEAAELGYYVVLDAPEVLSPASAKNTAQILLGQGSIYPCDGLVISGYLGSDVIKPFLPYCREEKKDIFVVARTASAADSLRSLRGKYPRLFLLLDGYDYPNANARNCSNAFDKFGHGAVACGGSSITCAWRQAESDGRDYLDHAKAAAERMKRNLTRYVTIL